MAYPFRMNTVMMYSRASASDYDDWKTVHENPGWGSNELIPLLKKTETYQIASDAPTHGTDGPLKVSRSLVFLDLGDQYLQVAGALDPARARAEPDTDTNDLSTINVYTRWPKFVHGSSSRARAWCALIASFWEQVGKRRDRPSL